jgi:tRNA (mo5U34)-methyltransferase
MEVAPGVETPGWFDLRPIVDRMPWPDLQGKRCLEVGPYDGYLSFEMERRGASEVIAADIGSPAEWDWPIASRVSGPAAVAAMSGERTGGGFRIAKEALGSKAERVEISAYDLSEENVGTFDFVICGSLMLHLRDPVRALEAIRGVCRGGFLSAETISVGLTLAYGRKPAARLRGGDRCQWWIPNPAGHGLMLEAAGFEVDRAVRPYAIPLGAGHPDRRSRLRASLEHYLAAPVTRGVGVPHSAILCHPRELPA